jgi:hypothetical protein
MADPFPRNGRDLRLDFFRGLSLFFIFIDHIPENILTYITLHTFAFSDAAEVFIFISGYTTALVYGRSLRQHGALFATAQIYRRVWQLYVAHIFLFVIFTAEVSYTLLVTKDPLYTEELGVGDFLQEPHVAVIRALLLQFQPNFLDILPLYIVLLAVFPLVLIALERQPLVPLVASAAVYALTLRKGWALHGYPPGHVWFFNPLAWQFLFIIGAAAGHSRLSGDWPFPKSEWLSRLAIVVAGASAVISFTWVAHWVYDPLPGLLLKSLWSFTVDKTNLAPLRLVSFLALAMATVRFVTPQTAFLRSRWAWPFVLCGRHSLYVFCLGIVLSVLGHFVLAELYGGLAMQIAVNVVGMTAMIGTAVMIDWFRTAGRSRPGDTPVPATPSE